MMKLVIWSSNLWVILFVLLLILLSPLLLLLLLMSMYSISQEICTRFCCALLCCGYAIGHNEFTWSIIHIHQGCFAGTGAIVRLPQCQWSKPDGCMKISQCITTTQHSKAKTVCIFLGIYCTMETVILWIKSSWNIPICPDDVIK